MTTEIKKKVYKQTVRIAAVYYKGKKVTRIENLDDDLDQVRIFESMSRRFRCKGWVDSEDGETERITLIGGDRREDAYRWFLKKEVFVGDDIRRLKVFDADDKEVDMSKIASQYTKIAVAPRKIEVESKKETPEFSTDGFGLTTEDLFADENEVTKNFLEGYTQSIGIRMVTMKGKTITMIENLDDDIDLNLVVKVMRKTFETGGAIMKDTRSGAEFIKLNGDFRRQAKKFLIDNQVIEGEENIARIKIHGA
ncbi:MAG: hypothetical protein F2563_05950 [Actinobacteria bacterium]|uniref:Unannotated protein n=1 Tax=freshwater metagenome TaxID=449393 RepID=A0A6J6FB08_9ZZZZ|nr:hypothetical protein [Actinomycetota bacterium]